jgi:hypothetical protein
MSGEDVPSNSKTDKKKHSFFRSAWGIATAATGLLASVVAILLGVGELTSSDPSLSGLSITELSPTTYTGTCGQSFPYRVRIAAISGHGSVTYELFVAGASGQYPSRTIELTAARPQVVTEFLQLRYSGSTRALWEILSPQFTRGVLRTITVKCHRP